MNDRVFLVDLENMQTVALVKVPDDAEVMVFYGIVQKTLPAELAVKPLDDYTRLVAEFRNDKTRKTLPGKRERLESRLKPLFPELGTEKRLALVRRLFDEGLVIEAENAIKFNL